jgi:pimeloyl-ACP methyl ester carboxylesterase
MPSVRVNNKQISYWEGKDEEQAGRETILFIHGAGGGQFTWSFQKRFFERHAHPIVIELPGHGESGGDGEEDIGRYAEHVHSFMKTLNLPKTFLVGHSMGGAIVQTLALGSPEGVRGIVLVGTGARLRVLPTLLEGIKHNFTETVFAMTRYAFSRKAPEQFIEKGIDQLMQVRPEVLYGDFLACDRFDLMKEVEKIQVPALIVCGDEDEMTPAKYSQYLHDRIKGSRLEVLPRAGHMVMMESAEAFNERVKGFVKNSVSSRNR